MKKLRKNLIVLFILCFLSACSSGIDRESSFAIADQTTKPVTRTQDAGSDAFIVQTQPVSEETLPAQSEMPPSQTEGFPEMTESLPPVESQTSSEETSEAPTGTEEDVPKATEEEPFDLTAYRVADAQGLYEISSLIPDSVERYSFFQYGEKLGVLAYRILNKSFQVDILTLDLTNGRWETICRDIEFSRPTKDPVARTVFVVSLSPLILYSRMGRELYFVESGERIVMPETGEAQEVFAWQGDVYGIDQERCLFRLTESGECETVYTLPRDYKALSYRPLSEEEDVIGLSAVRILDGQAVRIAYSPLVAEPEVFVETESRELVSTWGMTTLLRESNRFIVLDEEAARQYSITVGSTGGSRYIFSPTALGAGYVSFVGVDRKGIITKAYLWHYEEIESMPFEMPSWEPCPLPEGEDYQAMWQLWEELQAAYPLQILLGSDVPDVYCGYSTTALMEPAQIRQALTGLKEVLERYPQGFFDQLANGLKVERLTICLCAELISSAPNGELFYWGGVTSVSAFSPDPVGFAVVFEIETEWSFTRTIAHETSHLMDAFFSFSQMDWLQEQEKWEALNPPGFAYYEDYFMPDGKVTFTGEDRMWTTDSVGFWDAENVYFADNYSKVDQGEDRARLMEIIMAEERDPSLIILLLSSSHIRAKYELIFSWIRQSFDISSWEKPYWEERYEDMQKYDYFHGYQVS